jgi:predicted house-cleaning noncanonical NTP pyrophosphatase (MazG superfamily)
VVSIKLVRDKIGPRPDMEIRFIGNDMHYAIHLNAKLMEECREAVTATTREAFIEELADIAEVIEAIMTHTGISEEELREAKATKFAAKGGFVERKLAIIGKVD